jgi:ubiquinone biosynthesis protein
MRAVCEPVFERPLGEISFGQLLVYLFRTAGRFDMQVQPSLVLLQKTLLNIEGLGRQLYPQLNLWDTAQPYLEQWVQDRYSPQSLLRRLQRQAPSWLEQLPQLPDVVRDNLQGKDLDFRPAPTPQTTAKQQQSSGAGTSRQRRQFVGVSAALAAAVTVIPDGWHTLADGPAITWILVAAALALLWPRDS